ncbi:MAG TPA: glycerophosphodiester phosphodiesterase family protein [Candidatus Limnocylindrales bacterium]|nr:glycerophosphodiester phosphodiesterase family protein [Candidatus Limnocylindrales bacterium]
MDWSTSGRLRIGGHRGAAGIAPENTMASFRIAAGHGCDYLELDVQLTADDVPVVFHDDELDRTTDGDGHVGARPAGAIRALDAGAWFDRRFRGERVPLLAEVLAFVERQAELGATIEAKGPGTGRVIAAAIGRSPAASRLSVCSFVAAELIEAATIDPELPRILILDRDEPTVDPIAAARAANATGVNLPVDWCDAALVGRLRAAGLFVAGGTVDDDATLRRAVALGIDACDSNRPDLVVPARDRLLRGRERGGAPA